MGILLVFEALSTSMIVAIFIKQGHPYQKPEASFEVVYLVIISRWTRGVASRRGGE